MLASISTDDLRAIIVMGRSGDLARAAQELDITTQSLTQLARRFERQIGVPIFLWRQQEVGLTAPGRIFIERAKLALYLLRQTVDQMNVPADVLQRLVVPPPLPPIYAAPAKGRMTSLRAV
jgi:DNA-binding transcriptional LysR family regulator